MTRVKTPDMTGPDGYRPHVVDVLVTARHRRGRRLRLLFVRIVHRPTLSEEDVALRLFLENP